MDEGLKIMIENERTDTLETILTHLKAEHFILLAQGHFIGNDRFIAVEDTIKAVSEVLKGRHQTELEHIMNPPTTCSYIELEKEA